MYDGNGKVTMRVLRFLLLAVPLLVIAFILIGGTPAWEKGMAFVLNAARSGVTSVELSSLARTVSTECQRGTPIPANRFSAWVREVTHTDSPDRRPELDHFGRPYELVRIGAKTWVRSLGADGIRGTKDDLTAEVKCQL